MRGQRRHRRLRLPGNTQQGALGLALGQGAGAGRKHVSISQQKTGGVNSGAARTCPAQVLVLVLEHTEWRSTTRADTATTRPPGRLTRDSRATDCPKGRRAAAARILVFKLVQIHRQQQQGSRR